MIYIKSGVYTRDYQWGGISGTTIHTRDLTVIGYGDDPVIIAASADPEDHTWTQGSSPNTNTYSTNRSTTYEVVDLKHRDEEGHPLRLTKVADLATCHSTPNSWFIDGSNDVHVHTLDTRDPSYDATKPYESVLLMLASAGAQLQTSGQRVFFENIEFIGGRNGSIAVDNQGSDRMTVVASECLMSYTEESLSNGQFETRGGPVDTILHKCNIRYSANDGANYHGDSGVVQRALEIDCIEAKSFTNPYDYHIQGLTLEGEQLMQQLGNKRLWPTICHMIESKGLDVSFHTIKAVSAKAVEKILLD